jgi:protein SCO1/2
MPLIVRHALILVMLAFLSACQPAPEPPDTPAPAVDLKFELVDESGLPVSEADFDGQLRLVFFGFTSCPDICPITLQNVSAALRTMGDAASDIAVLFVSIDPHRDTPERLALYTDAFHPAVVGLTGSREQLTALASLFRTTFGYTVTNEQGQQRPLGQTEYEALPKDAQYVPYHSSQLYVVGWDGRLLDIIGYGSPPSQIETVLRSHLD